MLRHPAESRGSTRPLPAARRRASHFARIRRMQRPSAAMTRSGCSAGRGTPVSDAAARSRSGRRPSSAKLVFFTQHMPMNLRSPTRLQRRRRTRRTSAREPGHAWAVFRQQPAGKSDPPRPFPQRIHAVAAQPPVLAQRRSQCAAERIGVSVRLQRRLADGARAPPRGTPSGLTLAEKSRGVMSVSFADSPTVSPPCIDSSSSVQLLDACSSDPRRRQPAPARRRRRIIRLARRMSSGSIAARRVADGRLVVVLRRNRSPARPAERPAPRRRRSPSARCSGWRGCAGRAARCGTRLSRRCPVSAAAAIQQAAPRSGLGR